MVTRATIIEVDAVGSSPQGVNSFLQIDRLKECESASWRNSMQIDEHEKTENRER